MGIEMSSAGSKVFHPEAPDGVEVETADLWSLSGFNNLVL
jgi:hypothetical protein